MNENICIVMIEIDEFAFWFSDFLEGDEDFEVVKMLVVNS